MMDRAQEQIALFNSVTLPEGFQYQPDLLSSEQEQRLLDQMRGLPFKEFQFQGFVGKRRGGSYGWGYDFNERVIRKAEDIPAFLLPLREAAAGFAGLAPEQLVQVLLTEYDAGASIGWHPAKENFGGVIGISLLSACRFRFRRKAD